MTTDRRTARTAAVRRCGSRTRRARPRTVLVFDSDSGNPYGACLATELAAHLSVELAAGSDVRLPDRSVPLRPLRPTRVSPTGVEALREVGTVARAVAHVLRGGPTVVVWARPYQKALLGLVGRVSRTPALTVVDHNPVPTRRPTGLRGRVADGLLQQSRIIVHSPAHLDRGSLPTGRGVAVVPHITYRSYLREMGFDQAVARTGPTTLLLLGALRPDKVSPERATWLVEQIGGGVEAGVLVLATRPRLELPTAVGRLGIRNLSRNAYLSDEDIVQSLQSSDVLLAPYADVTESGTVRLARAAGLRVLAFDVPTLRRYLAPELLVPPGDWAGYVRAARELLATGVRRGVPDDHLVEAETRQWLDILRPGVTT